MRNILTITRRELASYFNSAIAYIYLIVFIAINNGLFMMQYFLNERADMTMFFDSLPLVLLIFIPAITMRLWAEDRRENTFEMLLTFPMKPYQLVLGKFFASLIFYAIALACTLTVPLTLRLTGAPDTGAIIGGYMGSFLIGVLFLAVGIFISGLASEQIVAFVLTALSCFVLFFLGTDFFASFIDGWISGLGSFLKNYIGSAVHFFSFSKGIINIWDMAYFLVTGGIFLMLNGFYLEGRLRPKSKAVFAAAVCTCVAGIICLNWLLGDMTAGRFDITENKLYTVSDAAKRIMRELKVPVTVSVYITPAEKMPTTFKTLESDITGKLQELKLNSQNKLNYRVFHIEAAKLLEKQNAASGQSAADSLETTLQEKGVVPFQVESIAKDAVGLKLVYSAITISYKENNDEVLPRIEPRTLPDLEYFLFSRILKLTREEKPRIAVFAPLKESDTSSAGGAFQAPKEDQFKNLVTLMSNNGYDARRITLSESGSLPEQTNILLVFNPGTLNSRQLFEINKFLYHGGTVFIAAQGYEYQFEIAGNNGVRVAAQKLPLDINKLISAWGVSVNEDMLLDESMQMIQINTGRVGPFAFSTPVKIPNQISVTQDNFNTSSALMARLPSLLYLWGSSLDIAGDIVTQYGLQKTVLFTSSKRSWKSAYKGGQLTQDQLSYPSDSKGNFPLAVVLQGQFTNTFKDSPMPEWPKTGDATGAAPALPAATGGAKAEMVDGKPGKLIVAGCYRMLMDDLISNPGNLGFFSNVIDSSALGEDILTIRAKTYAARVLRPVSDSGKIFYRFLTIFLVPLVLVAFAGLRLFLRRREKQFYVAARESFS